MTLKLLFKMKQVWSPTISINLLSFVSVLPSVLYIVRLLFTSDILFGKGPFDYR